MLSYIASFMKAYNMLSCRAPQSEGLCHTKNCVLLPRMRSDPITSDQPIKHVVETWSNTGKPAGSVKKCYLCGHIGHLACDCWSKQFESAGRLVEDRAKPYSAKQVQSGEECKLPPSSGGVDLFTFLELSSDEETVQQVRVTYQGGSAQCVRIQLQGVPVYGIIDSGADITIIEGELFRKVAIAAHLKKRDFRKADKILHTYDQKPFHLDGRMDLDISFDDKTMQAPVYVKMDAHDQLHLSEGVCRQLGILSYHQQVKQWRGGRKQAPGRGQHSKAAKVPTVRVNLF